MKNFSFFKTKKKSIYIILLGVFLLGFFFRSWNVTNTPPSLYWDEVSQGYNSYSILTTGKDEHQEFFPLARFQAFGDYKAPVYIYLDVPFIAMFGKTELAIRLPSIIFGSLTILLVYFLVQSLLHTFVKKEIIGLISAFLLVISPWHIQLSRAAFEANIATFFTILGVTLFLYAVQKKPGVLLASSISFVIAIYSFNAHRIFVPLLGVLLLGVEWEKLWKIKKQVLLAGSIGIILLLPFLIYIRTPESKLRFQEVNIFSDVSIVKKSNELIAHDHNSFFATVIYNRRVLFAKKYIEHYFDFFSPDYLFFKGDVNPRFSDQDNGELFLWMLPLLLIGIYLICVKKNKATIIIVGWFLLAPVAAATARETPHALRSETYIPMYEIIAGVGATGLYIVVKQYRSKLLPIFYGLASITIVFSLVQFWHNYLVHSPVRYSADWQYGYKQTIQQVAKIARNYDKIYFTDSYGRAYIYVAWYTEITPQQFWKSVMTHKDAYGLYTVSSLGKYQFTENYSSNESGKILYVTTADHVPIDVKTLTKVNFLNGNTAFVISEKL
ncbi:hypothetical protein BH11PAT1_BH11PAT1_1310 [soil metagenome]